MKPAELALGTRNLPIRIASDERRGVEHASDGVDLESELIPHAKSRGDAVEEQRRAGLVSVQLLDCRLRRAPRRIHSRL